MTARSIQIATRAELMSREDFIEYVDSAFAEIRDEALREAADRAIVICESFGMLKGDINDMRRSILADKQEGKNG